MAARRPEGGAGNTAFGEDYRHPHFARSIGLPATLSRYFSAHGQHIKWKSEWAHTDCTVCGTVNALRVRTSGAFCCTRCGIKGSSLSQLQMLELRKQGSEP